MYVLAECGLIHKYLLKKEDVKRIEEETFFTVTIVKELDGYQVIEDENTITLSNGEETLVFKKADRAMWDFVYYLYEYSFQGFTDCKDDISENNKKVAPEVPVQEQPQNNELASALLKIVDVIEYQNQSTKVINRIFEKSATLSNGKVGITISICNIPSKELINALDKLQEFSNTLMFKDIPDSITKV